MTAGVRLRSAAVSGDIAAGACDLSIPSVLPPRVPSGRAGSSSVLGFRTMARYVVRGRVLSSASSE